MNTKLFLPVAFSILILSCSETKVDLKAEEAALVKADSTWSAVSAKGC